MKNLFCLLSIVFVLASCNQTNEKLKERISNSDSVAIKFYKGDGTIDSVVAVKIFRDSKTVNQLANLIAERNSSEKFKCGYDGSIHFFKMNSVVQDIDFKMNDANCMYFSFLQEGKMQVTLLSPQAKQLLESLQK
jgi:hypothetical protein